MVFPIAARGVVARRLNHPSLRRHQGKPGLYAWYFYYMVTQKKKLYRYFDKFKAFFKIEKSYKLFL